VVRRKPFFHQLLCLAQQGAVGITDNVLDPK
jgi:hypothetical protein